MNSVDDPDTYGVVVLGSGAAGLTAALAASLEGARVALFEKSALVGGTTALSGASIWVPNNDLARAAGIQDSREAALTYLQSHANGTIRNELAETLVDGGQGFVDFLRDHAGIHLQLVAGWPDYHPEYPGGLPGGGRTLDPGLVSFAGIEEWVDRVPGVPRRATVPEMPLGGGSGLLAPDVEAGRAERLEEGYGRALVAGLLRAVLQHGVDLQTEHRGLELVITDGRVSGVVVESPSGKRVVHTESVILATGGFEYDSELVRAFLRGPISRQLGAPTNTGDGLKMSMRVGAQLGNMREAWWCPVITLPGQRNDGGQMGMLLVRENTLAGSIMVNRQGKRFMNEATNYNAYGGAFHQIDPSTLQYPNIPAYMIFDQRTVDLFGVFGGQPGGDVPPWVSRAETIAELAERFGLPAAEVEKSIERFNSHAREGVDPDFNRGRSAYDRFPGGRTVDPDSPFSTLAPVDSGPFYGVEVVPSVLGTKGGPATDEVGHVLDVDGDVIEGLYAAGNVMAHPTGMVYGGAGGTLVVAGVWGMSTGRAAVLDRSLAARG